jgi:hypothetical protein
MYCKPGEHNVQRIVDWEGDPDLINGVNEFVVYVCTECGLERDTREEFEEVEL